MTNLAKVVVLAVIQGIAEFLPISSSGHIVVIATFMDVTNVADLNIVLHAGTLLSILVFYSQRVTRLMFEDRRVIPLLIVGTIPAVVAGLTIKRYFVEILEDPLLAGFMLIVTGAMIWIAARSRSGEQTYQTMSNKEAFGIGIAQAVAILPGISRSGSTISAGLACGLTRNSAATFSFLLAIPAIAGASVLEIKDLWSGIPPTTPIRELMIGATISFVVGLASLWWLVRMLESGKLHYFAYWCIPFGSTVVVWQLCSRYA